MVYTREVKKELCELLQNAANVKRHSLFAKYSKNHFWKMEDRFLEVLKEGDQAKVLEEVISRPV